MLKTIETVVGHWVTLIKAHEKLLIVAISAGTLLHFGNKGYDAYISHLKNEANATNTQIAQVEQQNKLTQAQLDKLKADVDLQVKIDDAKINAAKQTLIIKQKEVAALPLPELSKEWVSLLSLPDGSITPQPNGTVAVTTDAAHTTVNALESIPTLNTELSATQDQLRGCTDVREKQDTQITGLNTSLDLEKKGRAEDAKVAKQEQHKSWMRGFKWGAIAGFVGGVFALHKL